MILCLFSNKEAHLISEWSPVFGELGIPVNMMQMNAKWKNNPEFIRTILDAAHYLIIVSKTVMKTDWFKFLAGFCLARNCQLFLFLSEPDLVLPSYLSYANLGENINELKEYLISLNIKTKRLNQIAEAKEELLKRGIYFTPEHFFICIQKKNIEGIGLFLKAEFPANAVTDSGVPALCLAARCGSTEICILLLAYGCDINAISQDNGNNALMEAAGNRNLALVKLLIERGSKLDVQSKSDQTALMLAVSRGAAEIVEVLLQAKANTACKDVLDMTAEQYAKILKFDQIQLLFRNYCDS